MGLARSSFGDAVAWLERFLSHRRTGAEVKLAGKFVRKICVAAGPDLQHRVIGAVMKGQQRVLLLKRALKLTSAKLPVSALELFPSPEAVNAMLEVTESRATGIIFGIH
jgi:hypothetical protein